MIHSIASGLSRWMQAWLQPACMWRIAGHMQRIGCMLACGLGLVGAYLALYASPPDYQQGEAVRIMYVHVPCAWLALGLYVAMALLSGIFVVMRAPMAYWLMAAVAPIGCMFSLLTLATGSIWGAPMWGTWWVWDARLTSMLVLTLFYMSYLIMHHVACEQPQAMVAAALVNVIGAVNVPIVKFSVDIWNSLHQPASIFRMGGPTIHPSMLAPLGVMTASLGAYTLWMVGVGVRSTMLRRRAQAARLPYTDTHKAQDVHKAAM